MHLLSFFKWFTAFSILVLVLNEKANGQATLWGLTKSTQYLAFNEGENSGRIFSLNLANKTINSSHFFYFQLNNWETFPNSHFLNSDKQLYGIIRKYPFSSVERFAIYKYDLIRNTFSILKDEPISTSSIPLSLFDNSDGNLYGLHAIKHPPLFSKFNISTNTLSSFSIAGANNNDISSYFYTPKSVKASNGKLYSFVYNNNEIIEFDPLTNTQKVVCTTPSPILGNFTLGSNGNVYGVIPNGIFEYNITTNSINILSTIAGMGLGIGLSLPLVGSVVEYVPDKFIFISENSQIYEYDKISGNLTNRFNFSVLTISNSNFVYRNYLSKHINGKIYGTVAQGGKDGLGYIYEYNPFTNDFNIKVQMSDYNLDYPYGHLELSSDGDLYGFTYPNTLFLYTPLTNAFEKLYEFDYASEGSYPHGSLLYAKDSTFYGLAYRGGSIDKGVLFAYKPETGVYSKKHDFDITLTGANPYGSLIQASNGLLYGMSSSGGAQQGGTLFSYAPATGTVSKLYDFNTLSGANPYGTPLQATNGLLYGLCKEGGSSGHGTLYSYNITTGSFTKLFDFTGAASGAQPKGSLLAAPDGKLYGLTEYGGSQGLGTLFSFNPSDNVFTKHFDFTTVTGCKPTGDVIVGSDGLLYGLTAEGGSQGVGTLFRFNPSGNVFTKIKDMSTLTGANPMGTLRLASTGKYYGMANRGGSQDLGTVFEYDPANDSLSVITHFNGSNGARPMYGTLVDTCYAPRILQQPLSLTTCVGSPFSLSVAVTDARSFTWYQNGVSVSGVNTSVLGVSSALGLATYYCRVENECGIAISQTVTVTGSPLPTLTGIANPMSREVCERSFFSISVSGTKFVEWYQNGEKINNPTFTGPGGVQIVVPDTVKSIFRFATNAPFYIYSIVGTDLNQCRASITVPITVLGLPTVTGTASPQTACEGTTLTLTGSGALNYTWTGNNLAAFTVHSSLFAPNLFLTPTVFGIYTFTLTGTDANGCNASGSTFVAVNRNPTNTFNPNPVTSCINDSIIFAPQSSSITYTWPVNTFINNRYYLTVVGLQLFNVTITNAQLCSSTSLLSIVGYSLSTVTGTATPNVLCQYQTTTLFGSGAINYAWNSNRALPSSFLPLTSSSLPFTFSLSGIYTFSLTGTDANGCQSTDTATVLVNPLPNVTATATPPVLCLYQTTSLLGSGAINYAWNSNRALPSSFLPLTSSSLPFTFSLSGIYTFSLTGTDAKGCQNTDTAKVTVNPLPNIKATASKRILCPNEGLTLRGSGADFFDWSDGRFDALPFPATFTGKAIYTLPGTNKTGCKATDTVSVVVNEDIAKAPITLLQEPTSDPLSATVGEEIRFAIAVANPEQYNKSLSLNARPQNFNPAAFGMEAVLDNPSFSFLWTPDCSDLALQKQYTYLFWATEQQCRLYSSDTLTKTIALSDKVSKTEVIPNIITPNNDSYNDEFFIDHVLKERCDEAFNKIEIFNRWGNRIFQSSRIDFRWKADNASDGVYFYSISLGDRNITGYVVVAR